jgi:hypothetical protein
MLITKFSKILFPLTAKLQTHFCLLAGLVSPRRATILAASSFRFRKRVVARETRTPDLWVIDQVTGI